MSKSSHALRLFASALFKSAMSDGSKFLYTSRSLSLLASVFQPGREFVSLCILLIPQKDHSPLVWSTPLSSLGWMHTKLSCLFASHGYMITRRSWPYQMINWPSRLAYCAVRGSSRATWRGTRNLNALLPDEMAVMSPPGILERVLDYNRGVSPG